MDEAGDTSGWRERQRTELDALRGSKLLRGQWQAEREILATLEPHETVLAVAAAGLEEPESNGLVALTQERIIYAGGRVYDTYILRTAGTYIAQFIARRRRIHRTIPLERILSVVPASERRGAIALRNDLATVFATSTSQTSVEEFAASVSAAIDDQRAGDQVAENDRPDWRSPNAAGQTRTPVQSALETMLERL